MSVKSNHINGKCAVCKRQCTTILCCIHIFVTCAPKYTATYHTLTAPLWNGHCSFATLALCVMLGFFTIPMASVTLTLIAAHPFWKLFQHHLIHMEAATPSSKLVVLHLKSSPCGSRPYHPLLWNVVLAHTSLHSIHHLRNTPQQFAGLVVLCDVVVWCRVVLCCLVLCYGIVLCYALVLWYTL